MDLIKEKHAQRQGASLVSNASVEKPTVEKEYKRYAPKESVLDKQVSVRTLIRNTIVIIVIMAVLAAVFLLGRWSAPFTHKDSVNLKSSLNAKLATQTGSLSSTTTVPMNKTTNVSSTSNRSALKEENKTAPITHVNESMAQTNATPTNATPNVTLTSTSAKTGEGFEYKNVGVYIGAVNHVKKGDDWGTVTSIEVTIENLEKVSINPAKVKARLYKTGEEADWWDLEEDVPALMRNLAKKSSVKHTFESHISYSGLSEDKTLKVVLYDQYNQKMGDVVKTMKLS